MYARYTRFPQIAQNRHACVASYCATVFFSLQQNRAALKELIIMPVCSTDFIDSASRRSHRTPRNKPLGHVLVYEKRDILAQIRNIARPKGAVKPKLMPVLFDNRYILGQFANGILYVS